MEIREIQHEIKCFLILSILYLGIQPEIGKKEE